MLNRWLCALALAALLVLAPVVSARPADFGAGTPSYLATIDDFEESALNPDVWPLVTDLDGPVNGEYFWGLSNIRAASGSQSLWAIGAGADGSKLNAADNYPCGARSAAWLKLDLTGWSAPQQLDLLFDFWLNVRTTDESGVVPDGLFVSYLQPSQDDPLRMERTVLKAITAQDPNSFWAEPETIDLLAAKELYPPYREWNFSGQVVLFEFLFKSKDPPCTSLPEGVFIDDIRLHSDVPPGSAPTATPTGEVTPTSEVTPTTELTPTATESVTATPSDTPVPSETPTEGPSPTPTEGPSPTPTEEASATPTREVTTPPPDGHRIYAPFTVK